MTDSPQSQLMYKLGTVEAEVKNLSLNLDTVFRRLEEKIDDSVAQNSATILDLRSRVDKNETRLNKLEKWKDQQVTRIGFVVSGIFVFWSVFGAAIQTKVGTIL